MAKFSKSDEYKPKDPRESANTKRKCEENYTRQFIIKLFLTLITIKRKPKKLQEEKIQSKSK